MALGVALEFGIVDAKLARGPWLAPLLETTEINHAHVSYLHIVQCERVSLLWVLIPVEEARKAQPQKPRLHIRL